VKLKNATVKKTTKSATNTAPKTEIKSERKENKKEIMFEDLTNQKSGGLTVTNQKKSKSKLIDKKNLDSINERYEDINIMNQSISS